MHNSRLENNLGPLWCQNKTGKQYACIACQVHKDCGSGLRGPHNMQKNLILERIPAYSLYFLYKDFVFRVWWGSSAVIILPSPAVFPSTLRKCQENRIIVKIFILFCPDSVKSKGHGEISLPVAHLQIHMIEENGNPFPGSLLSF